ncbi:MAG: ADP-ribosylglycohydrolase family protein [Candidatus Hydrogenedentes bacterium]|nr:ADP-ribosylglycohydrolase family protein [Candidatus Hydrogenedentota bacterium]
MDTQDRFRGCLLGLAAGDAIGTSVEFSPRGTFEPLTDMVGGGPFRLKPGQWTDDTSMALCLATSLIECNKFDAQDQMERYSRWAETGYLSSTGDCFDIGGTISSALQKFKKTGDPFSGSTAPRSAGNGCIMRLAPIPMFYYPDINEAECYAAKSSKTTHGCEQCIDASRLFARILIRALAGASKSETALADSKTFTGDDAIIAIAQADYLQKEISEIRGTGYVVKSLEAAMWCFMKTETFNEAVLMAANLGDDADTTAAICGQVAGAYYGESGIPKHYLEKLTMYIEIGDLADGLKSNMIR